MISFRFFSREEKILLLKNEARKWGGERKLVPSRIIVISFLSSIE